MTYSENEAMHELAARWSLSIGLEREDKFLAKLAGGSSHVGRRPIG